MPSLQSCPLKMMGERFPWTPELQDPGLFVAVLQINGQDEERNQFNSLQFSDLYLCSEAPATAENEGLSPPLLLLWASLFNEVFQEKEMIIKKDFMLGFNLVKVSFYPPNAICFKMEIGAPQWKFETFSGSEDNERKHRALIVWHHCSVESGGYLIKSKRQRATAAHCVAVTSVLEVREAVSVPWTSQINLGCENIKKKNKGSCHLSPINTTEVPLKKALWLLSGRHIRVAVPSLKVCS